MSLSRARGDVGVALLAADGTVRHRDEAFERLLGHAVPVGARLVDRVRWLDGLDPATAARLEGEGVAVIVTPTALDGVAAVVQVRRPTIATELLRDLRIARTTLASLLDAAPVSICVLDLDQRVTMWNTSATRTFGWTADEVLGERYPLVPSAERDTFERLFERVICGEGFTGVEAPRERRDGSVVYLRMHTAPMRDADGRVVGAMAILEDLTEQRRLEAQVRQSERLEAVGRLAGGIAHDFNNLLTVILGISEVLQRKPPSAERVGEGLKQIQECGEHARRLTAQLLAFSRRQVLHPEIVDLGARVRETTALLSRLIGAGIDMTLALEEAPLWVRLDTSQFGQMLVNLVVNARDAMERGGTLRIGTAAVPAPEGLPEGTYARLEVTDDGPGIPPDVLPHIFDPFYTTKRPGQGTGLGLATVHGVVEQSGGCVRVESAPGRTTFSVWFPLAEPPAAVSERPAPTTDHPPGSEAVLLVEDDPQVRTVGARMLGTLGYRVYAATDGIDALTQLDDGLEIALMITDLAMPRMGGLELAAAVRERHPAVAVIYVSANLDDDALRAEVDSGRASFLQKPFKLSALARAVRATLD